MEISEIKDLYYKGKFSEALNKINILKDEDKLEGKIWKAHIWLVSGERTQKQGIEFLEHVQKECREKKTKTLEVATIGVRLAIFWWGSWDYERGNKDLDRAEKLLKLMTKEERLTARFWEAFLFSVRAFLFKGKGKIILSLESNLEGIRILEEIDEKGLLSQLLTNAAICYRELGKFKKAMELLIRGLDITEELEHKWTSGYILDQIGSIHDLKGDLDLALDFYQRGLEIAEDSDLKRETSWWAFSVGSIHLRKGSQELALDYFNGSLKAAEELGEQPHIAYVLRWIGIEYRDVGELEFALEYFNKSLSIFQELDNKRGVVSTMIDMGLCANLKGEPTVAVKHHEKALTLAEEIGDNFNIGYARITLGKNFQMTGDREKALKQFVIALQLFRESKNNYQIAMVLFQLIILALEMEQNQGANDYLEELKELSGRMGHNEVKFRAKLGDAMIQKHSKDILEIGLSLRTVQELVTEEYIPQDLKRLALLNACELLLIELKFIEKPESLQKLREYVIMLDEIARQQNSKFLLVHTLILQSKLSLLDLDIEQAFNLLDHAANITQDKGLKSLSNQVVKEQNSLKAEVEKWVSITENNSPLVDRIEQARIKTYLEEAISIVASVGVGDTTPSSSTKGQGDQIPSKSLRVPGDSR
ncbi:MAG: tetratricopeptide repeat protein [Candidatus Hodarchaeales archaeon]|jgi:tetratricopeptide (TPR) repeat protein